MPAARWMRHPRGSRDMSSTVGFNIIPERANRSCFQTVPSFFVAPENPFI
jgi:hypothetical protein